MVKGREFGADVVVCLTLEDRPSASQGDSRDRFDVMGST